VPAAERLPASLDGVALDVAPASPVQQLRALGLLVPASIAIDHDLEPGMPVRVERPARTTAVARGRAYRKPDGLKLKATRGVMTITCHVSPDAGWPTLQAFLRATKRSLTVAMYDFGAKHIAEALRHSMSAATGPLRLNLDVRSNPRREGELTEAELKEELDRSLGPRLTFSSAAVGVLYPSAYHIKVAVRDGAAFWLSSGNWQGTNQPPLDGTTATKAQQKELLNRCNREWHVVVEHRV
jgi:hypothetical protein